MRGRLGASTHYRQELKDVSMDLRLYLRVIWRFRVVVGLGLILACALSFFSYANVSFKGGSPKIGYRQSQTWQATSLVFLTQKGFPYGYTILPYTQSGTATKGVTPTFVPKYASPGTFTQLAVYYAPFVQSDAFLALLRKRTHVPGIVLAHTIIDPTLRQPIPYINVIGYSSTSAGAVQLADVGSEVFAQYIVSQQNANRIPPKQRVVAQIASKAQSASISTGRKKTTPIVIFLTVLLAAIGLSFVLENLRPRIRELGSDAVPQPAAAAARRPA
jgi:hypothetical protein